MSAPNGRHHGAYVSKRLENVFALVVPGLLVRCWVRTLDALTESESGQRWAGVSRDGSMTTEESVLLPGEPPLACVAVDIEGLDSEAGFFALRRQRLPPVHPQVRDAQR